MGDDSGTSARQALQAIRRLQAKLDSLNEPVAIVGMGCRYPGAPDVDAFWRLLAGGVDAVTEAPAERWDLQELYNPDPSVPGKMVSRWGGFLRKLEEFDAEFFGITPREVPHVDPRQRIILEIAWEALEAAGIPPESLAGSGTGVYVATLTNDYDHLLFQNLRRAEAFSGSGTANSIVANRISYFLDLKGPSLAIDTACSGSLVAIHMACESLRARDDPRAGRRGQYQPDAQEQRLLLEGGRPFTHGTMPHLRRVGGWNCVERRRGHTGSQAAFASATGWRSDCRRYPGFGHQSRRAQ
jgi:hypothetical protein